MYKKICEYIYINPETLLEKDIAFGIKNQKEIDFLSKILLPNIKIPYTYYTRCEFFWIYAYKEYFTEFNYYRNIQNHDFNYNMKCIGYDYTVENPIKEYKKDFHIIYVKNFIRQFKLEKIINDKNEL